MQISMDQLKTNPHIWKYSQPKALVIVQDPNGRILNTLVPSIICSRPIKYCSSIMFTLTNSFEHEFLLAYNGQFSVPPWVSFIWHDRRKCVTEYINLAVIPLTNLDPTRKNVSANPYWKILNHNYIAAVKYVQSVCDCYSFAHRWWIGTGRTKQARLKQLAILMLLAWRSCVSTVTALKSDRPWLRDWAMSVICLAHPVVPILGDVIHQHASVYWLGSSCSVTKSYDFP